jgi:hypothetical protein
MKVVVTIDLYGYMDTNTINKGKRGVIICKQKVKNRDNSVQRALVISTSRCSYFIDKKHSSIIMLVFNTIRFKTDLCVYFGFWSTIWMDHQQNIYIWMCLGLGFLVFNATFNNISVISWRSVLLMEETGVPRENHRPVASNIQLLHLNEINMRFYGAEYNNIELGFSCSIKPHIDQLQVW